ncbi:MAG: primosomal protein N' [bacterium]|nr:primosomal protein N' [bacterium]
MFVDVALPSGTFVYRVPNKLKQKLELGSLVKVALRSRELEGWIVGANKSTKLKTVREILGISYPEPLITAPLLGLGKWMAKYYQASLGSVLNIIVPSRGKLISLPQQETKIFKPIGIKILPSVIRNSLKEKQFKSVLLYGHERNDIYFGAIEEALSRGLGVIFLIPEIILIPYIFSLLQKRVGDLIAVLHSRLKKEERWIEWLRIKRGMARVVIGTRSAIFAPVHNIGLIIIDEEQDTSYKSEETPKYSARDVAIMRAKIESTLCILGSATPSVETFYNTKAKKITLLHLTSPKRPFKIWLADMRKETDPIFSELLKRKIKEYTNRGEKVILFLNRRGFYSFIFCEDCGYIPKCPNCGVSLTYHKINLSLRCHYCGHSEKALGYCAQCKGINLSHRGIGTARVERAFKSLFTGISIFRLDLDTVPSKYISHTFKSFANGEIQVLLGTQLVVKPLNFPKVGLIGVISTDTGLNLPDFRATERTFSLLVRLVEKGKEVVLQTYNPEHRVLKYILTHNYFGFYESEELIRKKLVYPPYSHLIRILIKDLEERAKKSASELANRFKEEGLNFLGPAPCLLERDGSKIRLHFLLKVKNPQDLSLSQIIPRNTIIDVDPLELI